MASIVRLTNCVLASDGVEKAGDLYLCETTGKIVAAPEPSSEAVSVTTVDLGGRLVSPGLIDVQLNGCCGLNFSEEPPDDGAAGADYVETVREALVGLLATGVTSFLPTLTTSKREMFQKAIPLYVPNGHRRDPSLGSESLGIHCEGPFISQAKKGAHDPARLQTPTAGAQTIEDFYGPEHFVAPTNKTPGNSRVPAAIRKITVAPELPGMLDAMADLVRRHGTIVSMGHSAASYEQGLAGLRAGATMLTHTFNAMQPFLHRSPGLVGLLGAPLADLTSSTTDRLSTPLQRPFFGLIADEIHLHPAVARTAWAVHEDGCIITTDGTAATGLDLPDGLHVWRQGQRRVIKTGRKLQLEGTDTIAGGTTTLVQCVSNLIRWTGIHPARALRTVTSNPARFLGIADVKGTLEPGADADLVVLSWEDIQGRMELRVGQVWKFGKRIISSDTHFLYGQERINNARPSPEKPFVLGLPTGSSPLTTYQVLIEMHRKGLVSFRHVVTFNMGPYCVDQDEYVGLPRGHPQSYRRFMYDNFFDHIDVLPQNIHLLDGNAADLEAECRAYEDAIARAGGIDLFLGGMGPDGHIAFNEPGSSLRSRTRVKTLADDTIAANARFFGNDASKVPRHALTVGVQTVMDAREVLVIVTGVQKAAALKKCVEEGVNHMWTLSCLQMHPKATVVVDDDATMELQVKTVRYFKSIEQPPRAASATAACPCGPRQAAPVDPAPTRAPEILTMEPKQSGKSIPARDLLSSYGGLPPSRELSRSRTPDLIPDSMQSRIVLPSY
ncbi:Glucosamine-6-phosphate isomerase [Niveomyces insectorum RCEF 264]|uniref:glucosamine-6-phosphate deaminase n=1 Tax=Niveomyces insectorum RCEF 264 TaxID=1081102 RepID=A0A162MAU7_9HYPO|nr:Glucosamine-6-phosphate isomerase [Niveomyces insectorum RCEF 264]